MKELDEIPLDGKMDLDADPHKLRRGDYRESLAVQPLTENTQSTGGHIPRIGNTKVFTIPETVAQNKTYRIHLGSDGVTTHDLYFYTQNNVLINGAAFTFTEGVNIPATQAALAAVLTAFFGGGISFANGADSTDFTLTTILGYDYTVLSDDFSDLTIIQEAYDPDMCGEANDISSYDLDGDLFIWSTPSTNMPTVLDSIYITNVVNNGSGRFRVTTIFDHGLSSGQHVAINGVNGTTGVNGRWIITVINSTTFDCEEYDSVFAGVFASSPDSSITLYTFSIGEIGVGVQDINSEAWTYTTLIKSREFGFRTQKQIDRDVERDCDRTAFYWCDDYNPNRTMYYIGSYASNGFLNFFNSPGLYSYGTIDLETRMFASALGTKLDFVRQIQAGGQVLSGNWRYAIRLLTDSLVGTEWSDLSNPINVYSSVSTDSKKILGNVGNVVTPKINELSVTDIIPGLFKYIELAGVNYVEGAMNGYIIKRVTLGENDTSIILQHTGTENESTDLDLGTLNQVVNLYDTSRNIRIIDRHMVLSNLSAQAEIDLSEWASSFEHRLLQEAIPTPGSNAVGVYNNGFPYEGQDPEITFRTKGYMLNETYRLSVKLRRKSDKKFTRNYWVDDICINAGNTNTGNPGDNRRVVGGGIPSFDLTTAGAYDAYPDALIPYIEFSNIDLNYSIDGVPLRNIFDQIVFERVECVPEILGSGIAILGAETGPADYDLVAGLIYFRHETGGAASTVIGEYPFYAGDPSGTIVVAYPGAGTAQRQFAALYFPDIFFNNTDISFLAGDELISYGCPIPTLNGGGNYPSYTSVLGGGPSVLGEYNGYNGVNDAPNPATFSISDLVVVPRGNNGTTVGGSTFSKHGYSWNNFTGVQEPDEWDIHSGPVVKTTANITQPASNVNTDYGIYMVQYKRALTNKYGDIANSKYIPTGSYYDIDQSSPAVIGTGVVEVFGGDVFTQRTYLLQRNTADAGAGLSYGYGGGIGFYSQNRVNSQMHLGNAIDTFPYQDAIDWLEIFKTSGEDHNYNQGYNLVNGVNAHAAFDPNDSDCKEWRSRFIWSQPKPLGSSGDLFRVFLPLDFKDLDLNLGAITHHDVVNGELVSWQPKRIQRQYFNARGELTTNNNISILIGDGSVMSRDGQTLSNIGCQHKWSIIKGLSAQGNDVFYWIDANLKYAMRLGYDGTISISDLKGMKSWFGQNLKWVVGKDTPAAGEGICGVWDNGRRQVVWTVRGRRVKPEWSSVAVYGLGAAVTVTPTTYSTFEQTGEIYESLSAGNLNNDPLTTPTMWQLIEHDDNRYYNEYTLVYSEYKDGFICFDPYLPKIYLQWRDVFLTPRPISDTGEQYLHNFGDYLRWYNDGTTDQQVDGYITGVYNKSSENNKFYQALKAQSEIVPFRMEFETKNHESFLTQSEFEEREDGFYGPIKEDSTNTGINDGNTSLLWGEWMNCRFIFERLKYQELVRIFAQARLASRLVQK